MCGQLFAFDREVLLTCIGQKETGNRDGLVGKAGELGVYQMMPSTVRQWGGYQRKHAMNHLLWIESNLKKAGMEPSVYNIALSWNAGLRKVTHGQPKERHYLYARAVEGLYIVESHRPPSSWPAPER